MKLKMKNFKKCKWNVPRAESQENTLQPRNADESMKC